MSHEKLHKPISGIMGMSKLISDHKGSIEDPTFSFAEDDKSGWYLSDKGEITLTTGGSVNIIQNKDYTEFSKPIILDDTEEVEVDPGMGMLYKVKDDDGLWWKTTNVEINLANNSIDSLNTDELILRAVNKTKESINILTSDDVEKIITNFIEKNHLINKEQVKQFVDDILATINLQELDLPTVKKLIDISIEESINNIKLPDIDKDQVKQLIETAVSTIKLPDIDKDQVKQLIENAVSNIKLPDIDKDQVKQLIENNTINLVNTDQVKQLIETAVSNIKLPDIDKDQVKQLIETAVDTKLTNNIIAQSGTLMSPTYSFAEDEKTGMYRVGTNTLGLSADGCLGISVNPSDTTIYNTLVIKDTHVSSPAVNIEGHLYKKPNDNSLYWNTTSEVDLTKIRYPLNGPDGSLIEPTFAFDSSASTGLFKLYPDGVGVSVNGNLQSYHSSLVSGFIKPLELNDIDYSSTYVDISNNTSGKLYKKPNSNGLWWNTVQGELDLTNKNITYPLLGTLGTVDRPTYSFAEDRSTGIYSGGKGIINISADNNLVMSISNKNILINNLQSFGIANMETAHISDIKSNKLLVSGDSYMSNINSSGLISCNNIISSNARIDNMTVNKINIGSCLLYEKDNALYWKTDINDILIVNNKKLEPVETSTSIENTNIDGNTSPDENNTLSEDNTNKFIASCDIEKGSIVGITQDGMIDIVSGGKWHKTDLLDNSSSSQSVLYDGNIRLHTYERLENNVSTLYMEATYIDAQNNKSSQSNPSVIVLKSSEHVEALQQHNVIICKVHLSKYLVVFGAYDSTDEIIIKKIDLEISNDLILNVEDTLVFQSQNKIENFSVVYEDSGLLDLLVLSMYSPDNHNIDVALFSVSPGTSDPMELGYLGTKISVDPIIGNNKTMRSILLPGQIVVISYGNTKTFLLLPSTHTSTPSSGDTIIDADSTDCIDMQYDTSNGIIMSVEKTITNTCYLQILDIVNTRIEIIKSKKLGNNTMIPLGLYYNSKFDNFAMFYADSNINGTLKVQMFSYDGELFCMNGIYTNTSSMKYNPDMDKYNIPIPIFNKNIYNVSDLYILVFNGGLCDTRLALFNDNYGIRANAYIGLANDTVYNGELCKVTIKGELYNSPIQLPNNFVGKKLYIDNNKSYEPYPNNITSNSMNNVFLGTCISNKHILVGL